MIRKKGFCTAAAVLIITAVILSGCSDRENMVFAVDSDSEAPQTVTSLTFFGYKYEALNVMAIEEALHGYMDAYPDVSISYEGIKSPEYFNILDKRMATGNGDDIFMVDHERVLELRSQGKLADLSDLSTLDNFSDLAKSQMSADGTIDYLPTSISAFGLYCNLDMLKEYGQKIPENLGELYAVCDYFVSQGITPIIANNDISLKTVVLAKGLYPLYQKKDTKGEIQRFNERQEDIAETLYPGFELVEQILERGWVNREEALNTEKTKDDIVLFAKGERPFLLTGAWAVPRLRGLKPDFDFEVRAYPVLNDSSVLVINIDTRISINADSSHLEEARQFVEYLTQKDVMWSFVNSQSSFSPLKGNQLAGDKAIQPIGPYLTNGYSVLGADDNFNFPIWDMARQCIVGMLEGDSAQEACDNMREQIDVWNLNSAGR